MIENLVQSVPGLIGATSKEVVDADGVAWWEITPNPIPQSYEGGTRTNVPLTVLEEGAAYIAGALVHNPSDEPYQLRVVWCDRGAKYITLQPGETGVLLTDPTVREYTSTYRFVDIRPTSAKRLPFWVRQVTIVKSPWSDPQPFDGDYAPNGMVSWWTGEPGASTSIMTTPPPLDSGAVMNRWPDPEYTQPHSGWENIPGIGYQRRTTTVNVGVMAPIAVTPGMTVRVGATKTTLDGTPGTCAFYVYSGTWSATPIVWVATDGFKQATFVVPEGVTVIYGGVFIIGQASSTALVRFADVVLAGGLEPMATKAKDQVTLATLPSPSYVRLYYLKQASTLSAPAVPSTNPPAAPWSTTEPTYTEGSTDTVYTVMLTAYGSVSFEYGPVQKSASFEAAKQAYNKALAGLTAAEVAFSIANLAKEAAENLVVESITQPPPTPGGIWLELQTDGSTPKSIWTSDGETWRVYAQLTGMLIVPQVVGPPAIIDGRGMVIGHIQAGAINADAIMLGGIPKDRLAEGVQETLDDAQAVSDRVLIESNPARITLAQAFHADKPLTGLILEPLKLDFVVGGASVGFIDAETGLLSIDNIYARDTALIGEHQVRTLFSGITVFQHVGVG